MIDAEIIIDAFITACDDELDAPKPGNVHAFADGHGMEVADFQISARAAAHAISRKGTGAGFRVLEAVKATRAAVGQNTNLGILLLCAPLAMAAENKGPLRHNLSIVLATLGHQDARDAFAAISLAAPGGLGQGGTHDVRKPATTTLLAAMAAAADRDRIAWQYAHDYEDIFDLGLPALKWAAMKWRDPKWATLWVYLCFLSGFPDSHIARKHGRDATEIVRCRASDLLVRMKEATDPSCLLPEILAWDFELKSSGLNPGTSADLTVAVVFTDRLLQAQQVA